MKLIVILLLAPQRYRAMTATVQRQRFWDDRRSVVQKSPSCLMTTFTQNGSDGEKGGRSAATQSFGVADSSGSRGTRTRFPEVAMLIDALAGNVDPDHVKKALAKVVASLKIARGRSRENLATTASVEERLLHPAADVEPIAQDRHALKKLAVTVKAELKIATVDLAEAETRLHSAMLQRDPGDRYEHVIVNKLRAAGVTEKVARAINADHVIRIREALDGAQSAGAPKSRVRAAGG